MSALPKRKFTAQEYLALERAAKHKSQLVDGVIYAMAGVSKEHSRILPNFTRAAGNAFNGGPCYPVSGDLKVKVAPTGMYTYPDLIIMCSDMDVEDAHGDVLLNPKILVEVLSPSTERYDRGLKFQHYRNIDSLEEYILISQDRPHIDVFYRDILSDAKRWMIRMFDGLDDTFEFATIQANITMADIYRGIEFPEPETIF
jgi:Uma2 family endonuclease